MKFEQVARNIYKEEQRAKNNFEKTRIWTCFTR